MEQVETKTVKVVNRYEMLPVVQTITVPWVCLKCGGPRGEPFGHNFFEDGQSYHVDRWENPCGHVELYTTVLTHFEANRLA